MHQTRAGMAQIVKSDLTQTVAFKYLRKSILDVAWLEAVSHLVGEDVVNVLHIVAVAADLAIPLLHLTPSKQLFSHRVRHGKASVARFGLCTVGDNDNGFAVHTRLCDRVVDGDPVLLKVNGFPPKSEHLTSKQLPSFLLIYAAALAFILSITLLMPSQTEISVNTSTMLPLSVKGAS